ncbi:unnamed protein product [Lupinus luteus]|uniref:Uncharacterized protein n=1 Tax=Lupinus luteus TaxID=3873 RepID=A0AAV1YFV8_LUPLU
MSDICTEGNKIKRILQATISPLTFSTKISASKFISWVLIISLTHGFNLILVLAFMIITSKEKATKKRKNDRSKCNQAYPSLTLGPSFDHGDEANNQLCSKIEASSCSVVSSFHGVVGNPRKKLRLSKEESAVLEENFKEHSTLNPVPYSI